MFWLLSPEKTPKPDPKNKGGKTPAAETTNTGGNDSGGTGDDGGILHSLGSFLWHHPIAIPILLIAALIGIQYGWKQLRNKQALRGVAVRPLGAILKDTIKFAIKEDRRVIHKKAPWLTGTRLYAILLVLSIVAIFPGIPGVPAPIPVLILVIALYARASKIFKARRATLNQMFAVATAECRYPKGSELAPWNSVRIASWVNLVQPGKTTITIPAAYQSEDMKTREKFERNFNGTVSEENAWTYKWESAKNRITCEPAAFLPQMAPYPGPGPKWNEIPIGVMGDGTQATMPFEVAPHALICGPTGSGKSVLQRMILFHVLAHSDTWRIVAIDMKKVEMTWLRKYPSVLKVATDLEESVEVLRSLRAEMMRRYEEMEQQGVNHAKDLPEPPKAILCMIDETTVLLAVEGIKSDEGKERDELHAEAQMIIGELGRLSRASMIHVAMCFQRPDAKFLSGEIKANFDMRIAAGRMDTTPSLMVLDSEAANRLPKVKGRGMIRVGGELETFQGYFAEQGWYDQWVEQQEAAQNGAPVEGSGEEPVGDEPDGGRGRGPKRLKAPRLKKPKGDVAEVDNVSDMSDVSDAPAEGKPAKSGGLKGLAAKAAAKAEARAARLDAEQADEPENEPVAPVPESEPVPAPEEGEDEAEVPDDAEGLDFDDEEPEPEPEPAPLPVRPSVPQPVTQAPPAYKPGDPLPDFLTARRPKRLQPQTAPDATPQPVVEPAVEPAAAPERPTPASIPARPPTAPAGPPAAPARPAGLPVQPPRGLPVRPPTSG